MIEIIPNWHPIFVHFTIALLIVAGLLFVIGGLSQNESRRQTLLKLAEGNFWIGTAVTIATALAGWYAYNTVSHDTPSHEAMTEHRNWALATITVVIVLGIWLWRAKKTHSARPSYPFMAVMLLMLGLLVSTAWHGGEVVYRYGLGVMSLPKSEGAGHDHQHADGHNHEHGMVEEHEQTEQQGQEHHDDHHDHDHGEHAH